MAKAADGGPSRGATSGAANESGSVHRASVAASIVTTGLSGRPVKSLRMTSTPHVIAVEADAAVDDLVIRGLDGQRVFAQAKASLDMGGVMRDVAEQWAKAVKNEEVTGDDVLAAVASNINGPVGLLKKALDFRRDGTTLHKTYKDELERLKKMLKEHLSDAAAIDAVLDRATIAKFDTEPNGSVEKEADAALDGSIVEAGGGAAAFNVLRSEFSRLAARRGRADFDNWMQWLAAAGVPALSDPNGPRATKAKAMSDAVAGWRSGLATRLDVLRSDWLGMEAGDLHVAGVAAAMMGRPIEGQTSAGEAATSTAEAYPLLAFVRRCPRLLLVGQGGSGKSFALEQVAAYCSGEADGPTPLMVNFRDVAKRYPHDRSAPLTLREVVDDAAPGADDVMRAALTREVENGNAVLLFDALDEVPSDRPRLVLAVQDFIARLPTAVDVIMSSRFSGSDTLDMTAFPAVQLLTPDRHAQTLNQLLRHLVTSVTGTADESGIAAARAALESLMPANSPFARNPLLSTMAAVLIAQGGGTNLPNGRATLLVEVLRVSVKRWAARREDHVLPGLDALQAVEALLDVFVDIAAVVGTTGAWEDAHRAVADRLQAEWGLTAGPARVAADAALNYWDATAGVFVTHELKGELTAPVAAFTELGEAWSVQRDSATAYNWLADAVRLRDKWETVRLAVGLSSSLAAELLRLALENGDDLLDLVVAAYLDKTPYTAEQFDDMFQAQLARIPLLHQTQPTDTQPAGTPQTQRQRILALAVHSSPSAILAETLCRAPLTIEQRDALTRAAELFDIEQHDIITALATAAAASKPFDKTVLDAVERAIDSINIAPVSDPPSSRNRPAGLPALFDLAFDHLLPSRPYTSQQLDTAVKRRGSLQTASQLARAKSKLADSATTPAPESTILEALADDNPVGALVVGIMSTDTSCLTRGQRWHLPDLCDVIDTLDVADRELSEVNSALDAPDLLALGLTTVIQAAGFDEAVVRSEAAVYVNEYAIVSRIDPIWLRQLLHGLSLSPSPDHLLAAVTLLTGGGPFLAHVADIVLSSVDDLPDEVRNRLFSRTGEMTPAGRIVAGAHLALGAGRPLSDDPLVRAGQAIALAGAAATAPATVPPSILTQLLGDPDLTVRMHVELTESKLPTDLQTAVEGVPYVPAVQWTCSRCGTTNNIEAERCGDCQRGQRPHIDHRRTKQ